MVRTGKGSLKRFGNMPKVPKPQNNKGAEVQNRSYFPGFAGLIAKDWVRTTSNTVNSLSKPLEKILRMPY
jgi:hypothetical protein